jgi:hypothetical protein
VISDTKVELVADAGEASLADEPQGEWMKYDILPYVDQHDVILLLLT